jgi:hypothetical protein
LNEARATDVMMDTVSFLENVISSEYRNLSCKKRGRGAVEKEDSKKKQSKILK